MAPDSRECLQVDRPGRGLLRVTLARADRGNAINVAMMREILTQIADAEADPAIRMVALYGAGKHFCGGADIAGASKGREGEEASAPNLADVLLAWDGLAKPTVAFVQGACIGAALALASCCDMVVAAPDAFFSMPEVRLGMVPGLMPYFVRAVGPRAFRRYGLSGERFGAAPAQACGLVSEIAPQADWPAAETRILNSFLEAGPLTLAEIKRACRRFSGLAITPQLLASWTRNESPEAEEGKASFKEKRKPNWWIQK